MDPLPASAKLARYRAMRKAGATPEPFGGQDLAGTRLFVVQEHLATRRHFDLRLELGGTLRSWAVPRGPSLDPQDKRMAIFVEDHPVEYADFEGHIPKGNYGAGSVIVWDKGSWEAVEPDPEAALAAGKLTFRLHGHKLRGEWALVRTKGAKRDNSGKEWLLIKHRDAWAGAVAEAGVPQTSILSGLTARELADGVLPAAAILEEARRRGAKPLKPPAPTAMMAETAERPFSRAGWLFEPKIDGWRAVATRGDEGVRVGAASPARVTLRLRGGGDAAVSFPEIAKAIATLPAPGVILDGEIACLDPTGRPDFGRLQERAHRKKAEEAARHAISTPATFFVFDLLAIGGLDLRARPLSERRAWLERLIPTVGVLRRTDAVPERGEALYAAASRLGLEGIMAKKLDAPYLSGKRSPTWLKMRCDRTGDFAIVGATAPKVGRIGLGALHLATRDGDHLVYAGRVGTGFSDAVLEELAKTITSTKVPTPPCDDALISKGDTWCTPTLVAEVRYKEWTRDHQLRHPVFLRLRDDKSIDALANEHPASPPPPVSPGDPARGVPAPDSPPVVSSPPADAVPLSNQQKVFWPDDGYTKGDLVSYYRTVSPYLLPYLVDRPVVLVRYPDGITGKSFFQKDAPPFVPPWLRRVRMWSEDAAREIDHFVIDDEASLVYLANLAAIPLHVWASRAATLARPDWTILDLDPKDATRASLLAVAKATRTLCEELELPAFLKTSGQEGLHVMIPLGGVFGFDEAKTLAELLARVIASRVPDHGTVERVRAQRGGRVYVDFLQNGHGKLIASALCVRPVPGARVSMPLAWKELGPRWDPARYTIKTAPALLEKHGDPFRGVLGPTPDLAGALTRLGALLTARRPAR